VTWRKLADWAITIGLAVGFVLVFEAEVAKPFRIPSSSMEPTLHCARPGAWCQARFSDRVIVNRLVYRFESPRRGQIVVFKAPPDAAKECGEGGTYVKRLIGLPGESISESHGTLYVNGKRLDEPYKFEADRDTIEGTWSVPDGEYFFVGDDRAHTCDSRMWGSVPRGNLIGPVMLTYWPPNRISFH
jgi:signal peptidase I